MIGALIFAATAALCWFVGGKFALYIFKKKEVELSKKKKLVIGVCSFVLLESASVLCSLLVRYGLLNFFEALRSVIAICALLFAGIIDFKLMIIPNKLTLVLLAINVVIYAAEFILMPSEIALTATEALLGCAVCFVIFFIGKMISRKGMGMGDIKLVAVLGLALGLNSALGCLLWATILASITCIVLLIAKKLKSKSKIALAPFFFLGTVVGHIMLLVGGRL